MVYAVQCFSNNNILTRYSFANVSVDSPIWRQHVVDQTEQFIDYHIICYMSTTEHKSLILYVTCPRRTHKYHIVVDCMFMYSFGSVNIGP